GSLHHLQELMGGGLERRNLAEGVHRTGIVKNERDAEFGGALLDGGGRRNWNLPLPDDARDRSVDLGGAGQRQAVACLAVLRRHLNIDGGRPVIISREIIVGLLLQLRRRQRRGFPRQRKRRGIERGLHGRSRGVGAAVIDGGADKANDRDDCERDDDCHIGAASANKDADNFWERFGELPHYHDKLR